MTLPLRIGEPASAELMEAVRWYEGRQPGLGARLLAAVGDALDLIEQNPVVGAPVRDVARGRFRRLVLQGFHTRSSMSHGPRKSR